MFCLVSVSDASRPATVASCQRAEFSRQSALSPQQPALGQACNFIVSRVAGWLQANSATKTVGPSDREEERRVSPAASSCQSRSPTCSRRPSEHHQLPNDSQHQQQQQQQHRHHQTQILATIERTPIERSDSSSSRGGGRGAGRSGRQSDSRSEREPCTTMTTT